MVSFWQLILIFAIVLILFGAGKVPLIMRDLGSGLRAFKKGIEGVSENEDESSRVSNNNTRNNSKKVRALNDKSSSKSSRILNSKSASNSQKETVSGKKKTIAKKVKTKKS